MDDEQDIFNESVKKVDLGPLADSIKRFNKACKANYVFIQEEVDHIINAQDTDIKTIERCLDFLLDYAYCGLGEPEFKKLNGYYSTIHQENSEFYAKEYKK